MRTGPKVAGMVLAMAGFLVGCQTAPRPAAAVQDEQGLALSQADADLAEALANYGMGVLREGMADSGALANYERAAQLEPDRLDLYLRVAAVHLRAGQSTEAVEAIREACRRNPRSAEARMYLAQINQALKQWDAARELCLEAIKLAPGNYRGYLQLASVYREQGADRHAITVLEDAQAKVDDQRPILRLLGDLYLRRAGNVTAGKLTPDLQQAIDYYKRASTQPKDDLTIPYLQQLGDLYLLTRQIDSAIDCFAVVAAQNPDDIPTQKKLALCYLATGEREKAVQYLKVIADREPQNAEVQYYLGELYENLADTTNALSRFIAACEAAPSTNKPFLKLALFYMQSDPQKARQVLESGSKQLPEDQEMLEMLAQLYLAAGEEDAAGKTLDRLREIVIRQPDRVLAARQLTHYGLMAQRNNLAENAASLYQRALALDPSLLDAYVRLALLYLTEERQEEAIRIMKQADQVIPDDFNVNYVLGVLLLRLERYPEALEALERARELAASDPDRESSLDSAFYFTYASVHERAGQLKQAELLLQYAIVLDPENSEALNYLAYMWAERGANLDQALDYIGRALEVEPDSGAFTDTLGWIYFKQGRLDEALVEIGNAMVLLPNDPTVMEHMGDVLLALRRDRDALYWWQESFRRNPDNAALAGKLQARGVNLDELRRQSVPPPINK